MEPLTAEESKKLQNRFVDDRHLRKQSLHLDKMADDYFGSILFSWVGVGVVVEGEEPWKGNWVLS